MLSVYSIATNSGVKNEQLGMAIRSEEREGEREGEERSQSGSLRGGGAFIWDGGIGEQ